MNNTDTVFVYEQKNRPWQQEQDKNKYSEQDMLDFANWCRILDNKHHNRVITIQQLFKQFKKTEE